MWNLDQLKAELGKRREVRGWIIREEHVRRRERYFMPGPAGDGKTPVFVTDQDRDSSLLNIVVRLLVTSDRAGRQGEIVKKLVTHLPLSPQIDAALLSARQADSKQWRLPETVPSEVPARKTADPAIQEDIDGVTNALSARVRAAVTKKRRAVFNSAEVFVSNHDFVLHLSNGLVHRSSQSRVYAEAAYSMADGAAGGACRSDEFYSSRWAVTAADLDVEELFDRTADAAEHCLDVTKPESGRYAVIVDAEVLSTLLNGHIAQLSAPNAYQQLPFLKPGEELIPAAAGDLLTISLDPELEYGADTASLSDQGVVQKRLRLVERNRVVGTSADEQYAQYLADSLKISATTVRGNVVVEPGLLSHEQLTRQAPMVLEILQFSGLFADANTGTFSSEIRLARLFDNIRGEVRYIKGGSLSGSILENFRGLKLSMNLVKRATFSSLEPFGHGYCGPDYALLSDVSIVG